VMVLFFAHATRNFSHPTPEKLRKVQTYHEGKILPHRSRTR
jgi:hypothetical protein